MTARTTAQQFFSLFREKQHWLILLPAHPSLDAVAAALAFAETLLRAQKTATLLCPTLPFPPDYSFLSGIQAFQKNISLSRSVVFSTPLHGAALKNLTYAVRDGVLKIFLTPEDDALEVGSISREDGVFAFDAVATFSVRDFSMLGSLYRRNTEFFYETPVVNFDFSPANEYFGQVHCIDTQVSSVSEILFTFLEPLFADIPLTTPVATLLLSGIISQTRCFQAPLTTPQTLRTAGRLMDRGADHRNIIKNLYQNKTLPTLKLWGRALAKLTMDTDLQIVSSVLTRDDFLQSQATPENLPEILEELILHALQPQCAFLVYDDGGKISAFLSVPRYFDAQKLFADYTPTLFGRYTRIALPHQNIVEASECIFSILRKRFERNVSSTPLL